MAEIIKGSEVAAAIREQIRSDIAENNVSPCLAVVRAGAKESDLAYERGIRKTCENTGIELKVFEYPENISQADFEKEFRKVNSDTSVHGILLFKPLPAHLDEQVFNDLIDPEKDMDCMSPVNWARLALGDESGYCPCTAEAVIRILEYTGTELTGKKAVVIGRSQVIGKPLALMLLKRNVTLTWCHSRTKDLQECCKDAEIIVSACGVAGLVGEDIARAAAEDFTAIDVGMNFRDGKMCGDMEFDKVEPFAGKITPVPGGVGSVTNTVMASHVVRAAIKAAK